MTNSDLESLSRRLDNYIARLTALEREVASLRPAAQRRPEPRVAPVVAPPPTRAAERPPLPPRRVPAPPPKPVWWSELSFADLVGARTLAWAGGVVTLLGILFFFVLAVNRGWIGPVARVSLGALASALAFSGGLALRRWSGRHYYSAYAAVGAGIGGGYATLLAATLRYHLVSDWAAVLIAAAIGSVAVVTALAWSSEFIAGLGLVGATLAPAAVGLQNGELSAAGTAFALLVFAGTVIVAVGKKWQPLLVAGVVSSLPQAAVLVAEGQGTHWGAVVVAAGFWSLLLAAAVALQVRLVKPPLAALPTALVLTSGSFAGLGAAAQFSGTGLGWALLTVAAVYAVAAAGLFRNLRELSALVGAAGLVLGAIGVAQLLSGPALAIAWAGEAAALAWLAHRVGEQRYELAAVAYLAAALVHALALDAPPRQLYLVTGHPASGVLAFVGVALAGSIVGFYARPWRTIVGWTSAAAALYAASLGILAVAEPAFGWGQVGVIGLWGAVALAVLQTGLTLSWQQFRIAGLALLAVVLAQAAVFVSTQLSGDPRGFAFLVAAATLLAGALLDRLQRPEEQLFLLDAAYAGSSLALAVAGIVLLIGGPTAEALLLLALAGGYCAVAAAIFRRDRDFATILWAPALAVAFVAYTEPLSGTWLVLAWAATAAAIAVIADRAGERRLQIPAFGYTLFALTHALVVESPPHDFFAADRHPANGVPAILLVALAAVVVGLSVRGNEARQRGFVAVAAALTLYGVSLSILGLAEVVGAGTVADRFHAGHSAVSAVWGLLGLLALYAGLSRRLGWLQALGFGLFAVSLAKIFLFDLTFLSSVARALSFLAVGAVLLLGGFFVQKLGAQRRDAPV